MWEGVLSPSCVSVRVAGNKREVDGREAAFVLGVNNQLARVFSSFLHVHRAGSSEVYALLRHSFFSIKM